MTEETKETPRAARRKDKLGAKTFGWTLFLLILLIVAYVIAHAITLRENGNLHYEAADVVGARQDLLVTVAMLEEQLETPMATASPAVQALLHDLEQSVLQAENRGEVTSLFEAAVRDLTELGIQKEVSPKILEAAQSRANEFISASEEEKEVPKQLFQAALESAQAWVLDALGAPALLEQVEKLQKTAEGLGHGADSKVGKILAEIAKELAAERPTRRLVAQLLSQVAAEIRGPQSLFWSHSVLRWVEVMAWSLIGMLLVRLWIIGKYMAIGKYEPKWNWWWWAKIVQAPLLAVGVVLALSYFELGLVSGETLGLKISLRGQPIEFLVAVSLLLGMFGDRTYDFLDSLADKVLPKRSKTNREGNGDEDENEDENADDGE